MSDVIDDNTTHTFARCVMIVPKEDNLTNGNVMDYLDFKRLKTHFLQNMCHVP